MNIVLSDMQWQNINKEVLPFYSSFYTLAKQKASEYSPLGLYIWKDLYDLKYTVHDAFLIREKSGEYWAPVGNWENINWIQYNFPALKARFLYVPEALCIIWKDIFGNSIEVIEDRNSWDYIYTAQELAELPGRRYAKKRNHFSRFIKETKDFQVLDITDEISTVVAKAYIEWANTIEDFTPALLAEKQAIITLLDEWALFPSIKGICIVVDGAIASFAIGEALSEDTFVVQIEKSLCQIAGIYQAVNKFFAEKLYEEGYIYLNRCDDSGACGLRIAKESYNPTTFIKKYTVQFL